MEIIGFMGRIITSEDEAGDSTDILSDDNHRYIIITIDTQGTHF